MKKRILCLALSLLLVLAVLEPGLPRAAAEAYSLWVGGVQVTSENKDQIPVAGGSARYDPGTCTLTLEQVTGVNGLHTVSENGCMIYANGLDLVIRGSAVLSNPAAVYGIRTASGSLTVRGSLEISCGGSAVRCGTLVLSGCAITSPGDARIYGGQIYRGDGAPASAVSIAPTLPVILTQPADASALIGKPASFRVTAAGVDLSYQWYYSKTRGESWSIWAGKTDPVLTVTASATNNGCLYRCAVSNPAGSLFSSTAVLTVPDVVAPTIVTHPEDASAALGQSVSFRVQAAGAGLSFQWYYSKDNGASWVRWTGRTKAALTVTASATNNGCLYRCEVSNSAGSVVSARARLSVPDAKPNILTQPAPLSVSEGGTAVFRVVCAGSGLRYQWQSSADGAAWTSLSGQTGAALPVVGSRTNNGSVYRCLVQNAYGSAVSSSAKLSVVLLPDRPSITSQPVSASAKLGEAVTFRVAAAGAELSYQWYYSKNGGESWNLWSGKTAASLTVTASTTNNGCLYRCVVSNRAGSETSQAAVLTVTNAGLTVLAQPQDASAVVGKTVSFTVSVKGTGLQYQWYFSKNNGASWSAWSGKTAAELTVTVSTTNNGCLYRCLVSGAEGYVTSRAARLTASNCWPTILVQPKSVTAKAGQTVIFQPVVWGVGLQYQWYYSRDNGANWTAWSGKTEQTLTVEAASSNNGCIYRCYIHNAFGVATTDKAVLTVTP